VVELVSVELFVGFSAFARVRDVDVLLSPSSRIGDTAAVIRCVEGESNLGSDEIDVSVAFGVVDVSSSSSSSSDSVGLRDEAVKARVLVDVDSSLFMLEVSDSIVKFGTGAVTGESFPLTVWPLITVTTAMFVCVAGLQKNEYYSSVLKHHL
jgi:hypothetical protein